MKLSSRIFSQLSVFFIVIFCFWSVLFYFILISEINDETDDYLKAYAKRAIALTLSGNELGFEGRGNNVVSMQFISEDKAKQWPIVSITDEEVYIPAKAETEPARTLRTVFRDADGRPILLTVSIPAVEKGELAESILYSIILLFCLMFVALLGINFLVFNNEMKPFYTLIHWMRSYKIGEKTPLPAITTKIFEFTEMHRAIETNKARNEADFERQKEFISNASHELQTPLAACRNRLELLADSKNMEEKDLMAIMEVQKKLDYIIRLNQKLLFLSKIENEQFVERKNIVANDLIEMLSVDFREAYEYKKIDLSVRHNGFFNLFMDEIEAHSLITNLLKNTYLHNEEGGKTIIDIHDDEMTFANTGGPQGALDESKIFKRFYQSDKRKAGSTGLGLAIVHAICTNHNLSISYAFSDNFHCFTVKKNR